jgi:NAD(P)-dependent dehydrogenase (short-subunit alcohol dehydrogenase family)
MTDIAIADGSPGMPFLGHRGLTRREALRLSGACAAAVATSACSNADDTVVRPEGVPLSAFGKKSTTAEVTAGIDLAGKTVLITGATSGLGFESMRTLAARGARILATGRTLDKAREACAQVGAGCTPLALELESLDSVRACSDAVLALGAPIDVLMCNAGIMSLPQLEQVGGLEKQFAVNHLGHFLLVNRLLDRVRAAPKGRVVVMTSSAYKWATPAGIEFDNLSGARDYTPNKAYGQSKTANGLFSLELARRLAGTAATSNSVNPGPVNTNLSRNFPAWQRRIFGFLGFLLPKAETGAATQCYVATAPALARVSGHYFEHCNPRVPGGQMTNSTLAQRLWTVSEELCRKHLV